jgi:hypothetical protein
MKVRQELSKYFNGYKGPRSTNISPSESVDVKESVCDLEFCDLPVIDKIHSLDGDILHNTIQIRRI